MAGKVSLRQKMINLMYLVFIAFMALAVSKRVLLSFVDVEKSLSGNVSLAEEKNKLFYENLKVKKDNNPAKFGELYKNALLVKAEAKELISYIDGIKNEIKTSAKIDLDAEEINYHPLERSLEVQRYFFKNTEASEKGQALVSKLKTFKEFSSGIIKDKDISSRIESKLSLADMQRDSKVLSWLKGKFYDTPAIAAITNLSQVQSDISSIESDIITRMLEGKLEEEVSLNRFSAIVIPKKSAFFSGDKFEGKIVLGAFDSTLTPVIKLSNGAKARISGGQGFVSFPAGGVGERSLKGMVIIKDLNGEEQSYPIDYKYSVVSRPNDAVISADKMNVLYRGVSNPISISIPGIPANKISVSGAGIRKGGKGYIANVTNVSGRQTTISVTGTMPDGKKITRSKKFRIKDIPSPVGTIRGEMEAKMPASSFMRATVGAKLQDFVFDLTLSVTSFTVKIPGAPTIPVSGSKMSGRVQRALSRIRPGDNVVIGNIKAVVNGASGYRTKRISPVIVKITGR